MSPKDPYDFEAVPDNPAAEQAPATPYSDEWADYRVLVYILLSQAVPIERINDLVASIDIGTVEDLATLNARLFQLASDFGIPRDWLLKRLEKEKNKRTAQTHNSGGDKMSWLSKKAADGPEMEHNLPTKSRPDIGGPSEGDPMGGMGGPGAPAPGGPKPPMPGAQKPPMGGGKPPMGGSKPPMPGGKPLAGLDEIKMLLDKGDLQAALDALKKLLPGGGEKTGPAAPGRAPNLGKSAPKPGKAEPAKPAPKAAPEKKDEGKEEKEEKPEGREPKGSRLITCGNCDIVLQAKCPTCDGPIVSTAEDEKGDEEKAEHIEEEAHELAEHEKKEEREGE